MLSQFFNTKKQCAPGNLLKSCLYGYYSIVIATLLFNFFIVSGTIAQGNKTITIFAASSLTDVMLELQNAYQAIHPETTIIFNFAGSSTLASQINEGAPVDIFASASEERMQDTIDSEAIRPESVRIFAHNTLVLVVPASNPAAINDVRDLTRPGILMITAAPGVPIRTYTDDLMANLETMLEIEDFAVRVAGNIVSEETNVRRVLTRIALNEADAAFVYASDITETIAEDVTIIPLPDNISPMANYVIAPLTASPQQDIAAGFIDYVLSDAGQKILADYGFCPLAANILHENTPEPEATPEVTPEAVASRCP